MRGLIQGSYSDSCGSSGTGETPQERSDEEAHRTPRCSLSAWSANQHPCVIVDKIKRYTNVRLFTITNYFSIIQGLFFTSNLPFYIKNKKYLSKYSKRQRLNNIKCNFPIFSANNRKAPSCSRIKINSSIDNWLGIAKIERRM